MKKRIQIFALALTLLLIWGHSCMPADVSGEESGFATQLLTPVLEIFVGSGNVTEHLVRKLAHFSEYTVLGIQLLALRSDVSPSGLLLPLGCGFAAAFLDETIQLFIDGRSGSVPDIWLDGSGVAFGILIGLLCRVLWRGKRAGKE